MSTTTMSNGHQITALALGRARALRLPLSAQPRCLRVTAGRVWLTRSGAGPEGEDVWLSAGDRYALPAGTEWVVEGWPDAQAEVSGPAPERVRRPTFSWLSAWPRLRAS